MTRHVALACAVGVAVALSGLSAPGWAQDAPAATEATAPASRAPETGFPVVDCAPQIPAPAHACVIRVPPAGQLVEDGTEVLAVAGEGALAPVFAGAGDTRFPDGLNQSASLVLIDLTPGPGGGRRPAFDREIARLKTLLAALPADERIAIYGFDEGFEMIAPFQTDRAALNAALDGIALTGSNTLLQGGLDKALAALQAHDPAVVKRLVVVSDGEDEAGMQADAVRAFRERADAARVQIVSLGFFWRPTGSPENAPGRQLMESLARGSHAVFSGHDITGRTAAATDALVAEADTAIRDLGARLSQSTAGSRFIVLTENPRDADVTAVIETPRIGAPDDGVQRSYTARLTVDGDAAAADGAGDGAPEADAAAPESWGLPRMAALVVVGLGIVAVAAVIALRRGRGAAPTPAVAGGGDPVPDFDFGDGADTVGVPRTDGAWPAAGDKPTQPPVAYLVKAGARDRFAIVPPRTSVGRAAGNDIVIPEAEVSANHAVFTVSRSGRITLSDTGSTNGTFRNRKKIQTVDLSPGDEVTFGTATFTVKEV